MDIYLLVKYVYICVTSNPEMMLIMFIMPVSSFRTLLNHSVTTITVVTALITVITG